MNVMKTLTIFLLGTTFALTGCKHCNCENANAGATADRSELNKDGTDGSGATTVNVEEAPSTRYGGGTSGNRSDNTAETERVTGGAGNADAETGTLQRDVKNTEPQEKQPSKPGTISTRATRGAGTGTAQGRKIN